MADNKKPKGPEDRPDNPIESSTAETATDVMRFLAGHAHSNIKPESNTPETVLISGQEVDPKVAYKNLKEALVFVNRKLHFNPKDLYFKRFPGNIVGESTENGEYVDPIALMHPSYRLAYIISHEFHHNKGNVPNDGLVDAYVRALGFKNDGSTLTEKYNIALMNFYAFIEKIAGGRPVNDVVKQVYNFYYTENYEAIYKLFDERYILKLKTHDEQETAFQFFKSVFPELEVTNIEFSTKKLVGKATEEYELTRETNQSNGENVEEKITPPENSTRPPLLN